MQNLKNRSHLDYVNYIRNLINDAKTAESASPSLEIKTSSPTMNLTSDGKYYISDAINLTGTYLTDNISITVSGLENAFVTKEYLSKSLLEYILKLELLPEIYEAEDL